MGSQQAKKGPEGRQRSQAKRRRRTLPLMPPGCHEAGYVGGQRLREVTREASCGTLST